MSSGGALVIPGKGLCRMLEDRDLIETTVVSAIDLKEWTRIIFKQEPFKQPKIIYSK